MEGREQRKGTEDKKELLELSVNMVKKLSRVNRSSLHHEQAIWRLLSRGMLQMGGGTGRS